MSKANKSEKNPRRMMRLTDLNVTVFGSINHHIFITRGLADPDFDMQIPNGQCKLQFDAGNIEILLAADEALEFLREIPKNVVICTFRHEPHRNRIVCYDGKDELVWVNTNKNIDHYTRYLHLGIHRVAKKLGVPDKARAKMFPDFAPKKVEGKPLKTEVEVSPDEDLEASEEPKPDGSTKLITELDLGKREIDALTSANLTKVSQVLELLSQGDEKLLEIPKFGKKGLSALKDQLSSLGFQLPVAKS